MLDEVAGMIGGCEAGGGVVMRVSRSPRAQMCSSLLAERQEGSSLGVRSFNNSSELG